MGSPQQRITLAQLIALGAFALAASCSPARIGPEDYTQSAERQTPESDYPRCAEERLTAVSETQDSDKVKPIVRVAPRLNTSTLRSKSCLAQITALFNVNDEGKPYDVCIVASDDASLAALTAQAVKAWRFEPKTDAEPASYRNNIKTDITLDTCKR